MTTQQIKNLVGRMVKKKNRAARAARFLEQFCAHLGQNEICIQ